MEAGNVGRIRTLCRSKDAIVPEWWMDGEVPTVLLCRLLAFAKRGGLDLHNLPVVAPMYTTRSTLNPRPRIPIAPLAEAAVRLFKDFWVDSPLPAELLISMLQKKPDSLDTQQLGLSLGSFRV